MGRNTDNITKALRKAFPPGTNYDSVIFTRRGDDLVVTVDGKEAVIATDGKLFEGNLIAPDKLVGVQIKGHKAGK